MDAAESLLLIFGLFLGAVLIAIALNWRRMLGERADLPLWEFLRREGIARGDAADSVSAKAVMQAELACAVCGSRQECRSRLAARRDAMPPANCPNAVLFDDFGIGVEKARQ